MMRSVVQGIKHEDPKNSQDSKEFILQYNTDFYLSTFLHPAASGYSMHVEQQCITSSVEMS